jgi:hypothetical protein
MRVKRLEDMSLTGGLVLMEQEDGSIIIRVSPSQSSPCLCGRSATIEFCPSGSGVGGSPRTHAALRALMAAMADDNADVSYQRKAG